MIKILYDDKNAFEHFPFYAIFYVKYCIGSIQLYVKTFKLFFKIFVPPETRSDLYNIFYPSENKTFFTPLESSRPSLSLRFMYQPRPWLVVISVLSNYIVDLKFSPVGNFC